MYGTCLLYVTSSPILYYYEILFIICSCQLAVIFTTRVVPLIVPTTVTRVPNKRDSVNAVDITFLLVTTQAC